jgi:hypothetical protein
MRLFQPQCTYPEKFGGDFRRTRFTNVMEKHNVCFKLRSTSEEISASPLMKSTAVVRVVAYRCLTDVVDDHVCIGEDTILEAVQRYTSDVIEIFGQEYLRVPLMKTPRDLWVRMQNEDDLGCLAH